MQYFCMLYLSEASTACKAVEASLSNNQAPEAQNKRIHLKETASSSTQAMQRARDELKAQVNAWLNSLTSQGYALREEGLIIDIDSNYGGGGSDYWVEISVAMEVYVSAP